MCGFTIGTAVSIRKSRAGARDGAAALEPLEPGIDILAKNLGK